LLPLFWPSVDSSPFLFLRISIPVLDGEFLAPHATNHPFVSIDLRRGRKFVRFMEPRCPTDPLFFFLSLGALVHRPLLSSSTPLPLRDYIRRLSPQIHRLRTPLPPHISRVRLGERSIEEAAAPYLFPRAAPLFRVRRPAAKSPKKASDDPPLSHNAETQFFLPLIKIPSDSSWTREVLSS